MEEEARQDESHGRVGWAGWLAGWGLVLGTRSSSWR